MIYENKKTKVKLKAKTQQMADIFIAQGWEKVKPTPKKPKKKAKGKD